MCAIRDVNLEMRYKFGNITNSVKRKDLVISQSAYNNAYFKTQLKVVNDACYKKKLNKNVISI